MKNIPDYSMLVTYVSALAFVVSAITEALKCWKWLDDRVPTQVLVLVLSVVLCPLSTAALIDYTGQDITAAALLGSFVLSFIVSIVAMSGWERVAEIADRIEFKKYEI